MRIGSMFLIMIVLSMALPSAIATDSIHNLSSSGYRIAYSISDTEVKKGQILTLNVNLTTYVKIYDLRVDVVSNPVSLVKDSTLHLNEIEKGLPQLHTFRVKIPEDAIAGTKYQIDLTVQGFNDPPLFDLLGWRPRGFLFWVETPQYMGDTRINQNGSITITVV